MNQRRSYHSTACAARLVSTAGLLVAAIASSAVAAPNDAPSRRAALVVAQLRDVTSKAEGTSCKTRMLEGDVTAGGQKGHFLIASDPASRTGVIKMTGLGPVNFSLGATKVGLWTQDRNATVRDADFPGFREGLLSDLYWESGGLANACWSAKVRYVGEDTQGSRVADMLEVVPEGGKVTIVWISRETHLPFKWTRRDEPGVATSSYSAYGRDALRSVPYEQLLVDRDGSRWKLHTTRVSMGVSLNKVAALSAKPHKARRDYGIDQANSTTVLMRYKTYPFVDVYIDGKGPFNFLIDTGGTLMMSPKTTAALGLKVVGEGSDTDINGNAVAMPYVRISDLRIGAAHIHNVYCEKTEWADGNGGDRPRDGIIGTEILDRFVTTFNYPRHTLTLALNPSMAVGSGQFAIPFTLDHTFPVTDGEINGVSTRFSIDTGFSGAVIVYADFAKAHAAQLASRRYAGNSMAGASGKPSATQLGRLKSLQIGKLSIRGLVAIFPEAKDGLAGDDELAADLGNEVFASTALTFDYQDHKAWAVSDRAVALSPSVYNRGGMLLEFTPSGNATASRVVPESPAWEAGLRSGDQVMAIDGHAVSKRLVDSTNEDMFVADPQPVSLTVVRGKSSVSLMVQPRDYIQ